MRQRFAHRRLQFRPGHHERITMLLENNPYPQDTRVRSEAESLAAAGHVVEVIAPRGPGQAARERVNGVDVSRFPSLSSARPGMLPMLLEYAVAWAALHGAALSRLIRGSTVLHLHNPPDFLFGAGALFRLANRSVVFDHHDLGPELVEAKFASDPLVRLAQLSERMTFAVATDVLSANESHAEIARGRGHMPADRVTVVRNGPPAEWTTVPVRLRKGQLAQLRLAYVGAIAEQDGLDGIAEILALLHRRHPTIDVHLTVIGDGDARPQLEAALEQWGVTGNVTITGWVSPERVRALIDEADVCVDPSPGTLLNQRSTMIKVTEYLALGKPVVAYDLLETRRTVGDAALLVEPGDTAGFADRIVMLADDPALRADLAERARERGRELTWDRSERALLAAYAALGRRKAARRHRQSPAGTGPGEPHPEPGASSNGSGHPNPSDETGATTRSVERTNV
jgi:glycosyltransferase involved in cell wall biosynthesis